MTTRSIEVEQTVTEEKEVTICDDCGFEVEDPLTFYPQARKDELPDLHYHEDCFSNATLEEYEPDYLVGTELEDINGNNVLLVITGAELGVFAGGIVAIAVAALMRVAFFSAILGFFGLVLLVGAVWMSRGQAKDPAYWFDG